ncbi:uncharacterized protein LOC126977047 [Leptidea sinapis]|uniref:uncharacterized protein LOC126977047 n=1 Tax=Leptidea sinapis TaxID=189913 RepID=UPI00213CDFA6|nr:uncharacterized protein LOC126977047 [Leptidea sinapis]
MRRKAHSRNCSCPLCVKEFKVRGLQYGKHIPPKERLLLDKLVRTRAVYDDIRAQLVTDSTSRMKKNANFKAKVRSSTSEIDDTEMSSAILELVNVVDRGAAINASKLSTCCSCCSCSSQTDEQGRKHKVHKHRRRYSGGYPRDRFKHKFNRKGGVRFETKHIKSDPCTCTLSFASQTNLKGLMRQKNIPENKQNVTSKTSLYEKLAFKANKSIEKIHDSIDKIKHMRDKIKPIVPPPEEETYLVENEGSAKDKIKFFANQSYQRLKDSQTQLKYKIMDAGEKVELKIQRSIEKLKETQSKVKLFRKKKKKSVSCICPQNDLLQKIKKDSILKFKDDMKKKHEIDDWICDPPCIMGTCLPDECLANILIRNEQKALNSYRRNVGITSSTEHSEKNINVHPKTSIRQIQKDLLRHPMKSSKVMPRTKRNKDFGQGLKVERIKDINKNAAPIAQLALKSEKPRKQILKRTELNAPLGSNHRQAVRIGSSFSFDIEFYKDARARNVMPSKPVYSKSPLKKNKYSNKVRRYPRASQVSFRNTRKDSKVHGLKRCFCTLKLKLKKPKVQQGKSVATMSSLQNDDFLVHSTSTQSKYRSHDLLPYMCEPGVCVPYQCDPHICLEMINKRLRTQNMQSRPSLTSSRKTKSTSSVTAKSVMSSKAKQVQSAIVSRPKKNNNNLKLKRKGLNFKSGERNVVRIGSTFSFNIEFYKNRTLPRPEKRMAINTFTIAPKVKTFHNQNYKNQDMPLKGINLQRYKHRDAPVRLKKKKRYKNAVVGTKNLEKYVNGERVNRGTTTKNKLKYTNGLENYECEPFVCTPGYCDPYECLERIKRRRKEAKDVSLGPLLPESKSTFSSTYSEMKSRAVMRHTPKTKERKILVKTRQEHRKKIQMPILVSDKKSRRSVTLGSSFSFNIEFSKSTGKGNRNTGIVQVPTELKTSTRNTKNQAINMHKGKASSKYVESDNVKKVNKSTVIGPILKRCFCTLNLIKKQIQQNNAITTSNPKNNIYLVNTAVVSNANIRKLQYNDTKIITSKLSFKQKHSCQNFNTGENTKDLESQIIKTCALKKGYKNIDHQNFQNTQFVDSKDVTGLRCYLKRRFCTMNMENIRIRRKLKPYECEPGICIPGQCNPYECQKLIMKRFQRNNQSITESSTRPAAIGTYTPKYVSKKLNSPNKFREILEQKNSLGQNNTQSNKANQKTRIGSSFSFDVEFFKKYSTDQVRTSSGYNIKKPSHNLNLEKVRRNRLKYKTTGTKLAKRKRNRDSKLQSDLRSKFVHHSSGTESHLERCFCTLNLNKKGKLLEMHTLDKNHLLQTKLNRTDRDALLKKNSNINIDRSQNTSLLDQVNFSSLLPYECEPGTCVPNECDPYTCYDVIKKRRMKYKGTNTPGQTSVGVSSLYLPRHSRATLFRDNEIIKKMPVSTQSNAIQKNNIMLENFNSSAAFDYVPGNQRVRIGSNFKFDIEFYKENNIVGHSTDRRQHGKDNSILEQYSPKPKRRRHRGLKTRKKHIGLTSTVSGLQTKALNNNILGTSIKPFLNRCFCTLRLHKNGKAKRKVNQKSAITMTEINKNGWELQSYECEPNVCVPYQCDPYECKELIKRRLRYLQYRDDGTSTIVKRKNSVNLLTTPSIKTEGINTINDDMVSIYKHKKILTDDIIRKDTESRHSKLGQAVRIGSNFSFEIEFSKGASNKVVELKKPEIQSVNPKRNQTSYKHRTTAADIKTQKSNKFKKYRQLAVGVSPFIERCFCTLMLSRKKKDKKQSIHTMNVGVETIDTENEPMKLLPYECEPNVCVPGECDPLVCLQRIQKRNLKSLGVETIYKQRKSVGSMSTPYSKDKSIQSRQTRPKASVGSQRFASQIKEKQPNLDKISRDTHRQAVRIGSNFSFDIEFYKNKPLKFKNGFEQKENITPGNRNIKKVNRYQITHDSKRLGSTYSQTLANQKDAASNMASSLERCFCTLFLQKAQQEKRQNIKLKKEHKTQTKSKASIVSSFLSNKLKPLIFHKNNKQTGIRLHVKSRAQKNTVKLDHYECEPYTCKPGLCNPYECLERIKRRHLRENTTSTIANIYESKASLTRSNNIQHSGTNPRRYYINKSSTAYRPSNAMTVISPRPRDINNQSVRLGSSFSFNVEFFKDNKGVTTNDKNKFIVLDSKLKPYKENTFQNKDKVGKDVRHKYINNTRRNRNISFSTETPMNTINTGTDPVLKRCFCTLQLQNRSKRNNRNQINKPHHQKKYIYNQQPTLAYIATRFECPPSCINKQQNLNCQDDNNQYVDAFNRCADVNLLSKNTKEIQCSSSLRMNKPRNKNKVNSDRFSELVSFKNTVPRPILDEDNIITHKNMTKFSSVYNKQKLFALAQSPYHQVFEVRRVKIQKNKSKIMSTSEEARSVGTKVNEQMLHSKSAYGHKCSCRKKVMKKDDGAMKIILPYKPTRFDKIDSKHIVQETNFKPVNNKFYNLHISNNGKRLSRKKSKNFSNGVIGENRKFSRLKRFMCRCSGILGNYEKKSSLQELYKQNLDLDTNNNIITSFSESKPQTTKADNNIKTSKSLKLGRKEKSNINSKQKYSTFGAGDTEQKMNRSPTMNGKLDMCPLCMPNKTRIKRKQNFDNETPIKSDQHCPFCQSCFKKGILKNDTPSRKRSQGKKNKVDFLHEQSKINKSEASENKTITIFEKLLNFCKKPKEKPKELKPLFAMYLDSSSMNIINAREITEKVKKYKKKQSKFLKIHKKPHGKSCQCCICLGNSSLSKVDKSKPSAKFKPKSTAKAISKSSAKAKSNTPIKYKAKYPIKSYPNRKSESELCVCGSKICAKKAKETKHSAQHTPKKVFKRCVCGSSVCEKESKVMKDIVERSKTVCTCEKIMDERREKEYRRKQKMLTEQYAKDDKLRRKYRKEEDKLAEKSINKDSSDVMLLADSLCDVTKLGVKGATDFTRFLYRRVRNPRNARESLEALKDDPALALTQLKDALTDSGVGSTARRIKKRFAAMKTVQGTKELLEQYAITNYLLHIASKDPKKRIPRVRRKRKERVDFNCNLFATSLRKKPFTFIFDRCPWFYPHCISLINVWRQFADVMLFLLAVVVWSPCILAMEMCRAVLCCTLCTG